MKQEAHLQVYDLTLTTRSPLFVGNGTSYPKNSYVFDENSEMVYILDIEKFFQMLLDENLVEQYEKFIFNGRTKLERFLREDCRLNLRQIKALCRYTVSAADALDGEHSLKEIHSFMRGADGAAYIAGSSVKGALRTAVLLELMQNEKKGQWVQSYAKKNDQSMTKLEGEYLNTLHLKKDKSQNWANDAVNSLFRGISISDSQLISDKQMILCGKTDVFPNGGTSKPNLCRECVKPSTEIRFQLTLDTSVLKDTITADTLRRSIQNFSRYYEQTYVNCFDEPDNACAMRYDSILVLGGGSGFFAKTLAYPYLGSQKGLDYVAKEMQNSFKGHYHHEDKEEHFISPHTMKYTKYQGLLYPYGICGVSIR